jgi:hypothetical protein
VPDSDSTHSLALFVYGPGAPLSLIACMSIVLSGLSQVAPLDIMEALGIDRLFVCQGAMCTVPVNNSTALEIFASLLLSLKHPLLAEVLEVDYHRERQTLIIFKKYYDRVSGTTRWTHLLQNSLPEAPPIHTPISSVPISLRVSNTFVPSSSKRLTPAWPVRPGLAEGPASRELLS